MKKIILSSPANNAVISMRTPEIDQFFQEPCHLGPAFPGDNVPYRRKEFSHPKGIVFSWQNPGMMPCALQISDSPAMRKYRRFSASRRKTVYNLMPGIPYYWRVVSSDGRRSEVRTFTLAEDAPRFLFVEGVTNVRDLGGWRGVDGRKIRYGMVFRGAQFQTWPTTKRPVSKRGIATLLDDLSLHTDLDLRGDDVKPFKGFNGKVRHKPFAVYAYATWKNYDIGEKPFGIFSPNERKRFKKMFELFAKPSTYPLYMHCQGGCDRTGTVAFLLGAALGMSQEDLLLEYELSNLSLAQGRSRHTEVMVKFLEKWESYVPGGTINEQVGAYLAECGIREETLNQIRNLLLEP